MTPVNEIFDFGKFYLVSELRSDATSVDIVAASAVYTMEDQKNPGTLFQSGRMVVIDVDDTDKFVSLAFSACSQNGSIDGKPRYTLTIRTASDASTKMLGLANTDDGTNNVANVIAGNKTGVFPFPTDSICLVTVGAAEYNELKTIFQNALAEIAEQSDMLAVRILFEFREMEQRLDTAQSVYEASITAQQNAFEATINDQFDAFVATQREITATIDDTDTTLLNISSGNWIDAGTERAYAGVSDYNPTDNRTNYLELATSTGTLQEVTGGFTDNNYPVAKVVVDAAGEITSIINYGAAYNIPAPPVIPSAPSYETNKFTTTGTWAARDSLGGAEVDQLILDAGSITTGTMELQVDGSAVKKLNAGARESFVVEASSDIDVVVDDKYYDIANASYQSKSWNPTEETEFRGIFFKDDGTKAYMMGRGNDTVYQYTCSTPYDISTASYDSKSFSFTAQEPNPERFFIGDSGTKLYVIGINGDAIYQYNLSTAWDISTASYASKSLSVGSNPQGLWFKPDGTQAFVCLSAGNVKNYDLSTAWDVSTGSLNGEYDPSEESNPGSVIFNDDGTQMFVAKYGSVSTIYKYELSTAWDITTATYTGDSYSPSESTNNYAAHIDNGGQNLYFCSASANTAYQYDIKSDFAGTGFASIIYP